MSDSLWWLSAIPITIGIVYNIGDLPFLSGLGVLIGAGIMYNVIQQFFSVFKLRDLDNRPVFISGCDTGFGRCLAIKCLESGMPVFAGCLTESGAEALRQESAAMSGKLDTMIVDVSSDESVASAARYLEQATKQYGGLHGVVNNAGIVGNSFLDDFLDIHDYGKVVNVNTYGIIRVTQALKHLVKLRRGRIVNMTSILARVASAGTGPYAVSKYAANGYCEVVRQELAPFGVSLHTIEPGFFQTPMIDSCGTHTGLDRLWNSAPAKAREYYGEQYFRRRVTANQRFMKFISSPRVEKVTDAYFHALTARYPHNKYQVGNDAKFLFLPSSFLPAGLRDAMGAAVRNHFNMTPHRAINMYHEPRNDIEEPENTSTTATIVEDSDAILDGLQETAEVIIDHSSSV